VKSETKEGKGRGEKILGEKKKVKELGGKEGLLYDLRTSCPRVMVTDGMM
jgi:hypothetical protein